VGIIETAESVVDTAAESAEADKMACEAIAEAIGLGPTDAEDALALAEATPVEEAVALANELEASTKVADAAGDSTWDAAGTGASGISSPPAT
jgi:hypothetical protein